MRGVLSFEAGGLSDISFTTCSGAAAGAYAGAMARFLRIYLALFLALAVTLTGHAAASMSGSRDAAGQMVICSGTGPVVVYVDDQGQPTTAPHFCPDCVMQLLDAPVAPDLHAWQFYGGQEIETAEAAPARAHRIRLQAVARAPPAIG